MKDQEAPPGSVRFENIGPRRMTQRRPSVLVRVVDTFRSIVRRLSNQKVKRDFKGPRGPSKAAAASPRCSCTHVSLGVERKGADSRRARSRRDLAG
jgi:hypothetical protein